MSRRRVVGVPRVAGAAQRPPMGYKWTPQAHYGIVAGNADTRKGYWQNEPEPDPEPEPSAREDAAKWVTSKVAAQTAEAAGAEVAALKAHAQLSASLEAVAVLEAGSVEGTVAWKLPGIEQMLGAQTGASRPFITHQVVSTPEDIQPHLERKCATRVSNPLSRRSRMVGVSILSCASAAFERLGAQWRLCMQTDSSDSNNGSLAVFLQRVGDADTTEPVAFALRVVAEDGDVVLAEHIASSCDFQSASQGWGKLRLHASLKDVHQASAKGAISVRLLWFRLASTPAPAGAGPALLPTPAAPAPAPTEGQPAGAPIPEGTPERRTERRTRTVRLAKGAVGFGMNIDPQGVVVSVIPGSPASDHGVPPDSRIVAVQGVPCHGKPEIVAQLGQPAVVAITVNPGVDFELDLGDVEVEGDRERDPAVVAVQGIKKGIVGGGGKALGAIRRRRASLEGGASVFGEASADHPE